MKRSIRSSSPLCEQKRVLRREKERQTASLSSEYIKESDRVIIEKLLNLSEFKNAETVFLYYSVGREVSTTALIDKLLDEGRSTALPVSGNNGVMSFYPVIGKAELYPFSGKAELCPGKFGIPEPPVTREVRPGATDIIIVPALCCDRYGNRLGHGAGYYDRYLAHSEAFSVCLCRKALLEEKLPAEDTDIAVSLVLND